MNKLAAILILLVAVACELPTPTPTPTTANLKALPSMPLPASLQLDEPSLATVQDFLRADPTNDQPYDLEHTCGWFTSRLIANGAKVGLTFLPVYVDFPDDPTAHSFIAILTSDAGLVFFEPQTDAEYLPPTEGRPLCDTEGYCIAGGELVRIVYVVP